MSKIFDIKGNPVDAGNIEKEGYKNLTLSLSNKDYGNKIQVLGLDLDVTLPAKGQGWDKKNPTITYQIPNYIYQSKENSDFYFFVDKNGNDVGNVTPIPTQDRIKELKKHKHSSIEKINLKEYIIHRNKFIKSEGDEAEVFSWAKEWRKVLCEKKKCRELQHGGRRGAAVRAKLRAKNKERNRKKNTTEVEVWASDVLPGLNIGEKPGSSVLADPSKFLEVEAEDIGRGGEGEEEEEEEEEVEEEREEEREGKGNEEEDDGGQSAMSANDGNSQTKEVRDRARRAERQKKLRLDRSRGKGPFDQRRRTTHSGRIGRTQGAALGAAALGAGYGTGAVMPGTNAASTHLRLSALNDVTGGALGEGLEGAGDAVGSAAGALMNLFE